MQGDRPDDQGQLQQQLRCPRDVHAHLCGGEDEIGDARRVVGLSGSRGPPRVCTLSVYSTWSTRQPRMEGPTGGMCSARPCHSARRPGATASPPRRATTTCFCFRAPRAPKVCVCTRAARGCTGLDELLSISAKMGMASPAGPGDGGSASVSQHPGVHAQHPAPHPPMRPSPVPGV